ncbi:MAG: hypothetical protein WA547_06490 [Thermoplasmata archaeon]
MTRERSSRHKGAQVGIILAVLGMVVLVGLSSVPSTSARADSGPSAAPLGASLSGATEYAVVFTETGLPSGTEWSITLNGTSQNSTSSTIQFSEPNGQYAFFVTPVSGYTVAPEGNLTVAGAPVSMSVTFVSTALSSGTCTSFSWSGSNDTGLPVPIDTLSGNCIGSFAADYRTYNATTGSTFDNTSFTIGPVAEVTPSGAVVALAVLGFEGSGSVLVQSSSHEVNVTDLIVGNVTNAIGVNSSTGAPNGETPLWNPVDLPGLGGSTTWGQGVQVLGSTSVRIVFHFANGTGGNSDRVKFDVSISGWPWVSASDSLGIAVETTAYALPVGSHLVYSAANDTISQLSDSTGRTISSLAFGPSANTTGSPGTVLRVTDQVGLYPTGSDPTTAGALLTFTGAGGYSGVSYDPWVEFGPQGTGGAVSPPPVLAPAVAGGLPLLLVLTGVGGAVAVGLLLGVLAHRLRRRPIEDGLSPVH